MENKPAHKPFWMLFTAEIRMSEILGSNFQTDQVPFWSVKSVVIVDFIQVFCHFFLASSEVKTQSPFLCHQETREVFT